MKERKKERNESTPGVIMANMATEWEEVIMKVKKLPKGLVANIIEHSNRNAMKP